MENLKKIKFLVIHHTQRKNDSIKRIKKLHTKIYGWEDIGYHYIIGNNTKNFINGKIYPARKEKFIGAHVKGFNKNSLGIALVGNFDKKSPTKKQINCLIKFLIKKSKENKIPTKNILGHREFPNVTKTCPGKFLDMDELRKKINLIKAKS